MTQPATLPIVGKVKFREISKEKLLAFWQKVASQDRAARSDMASASTRSCRTGLAFEIKTTRAAYRARSVLLAIGRRGTPRRLGVPGEDQSKVVYRLIDAEQYRGQHVLVVGGGDSALEAAGSIAEQPGTTVTLSYRSEAFSRAKTKNRERVARAQEAGRLTVMLKSTVKQIGSAVSRHRMAGPSRHAPERRRHRLRRRHPADRLSEGHRSRGGNEIWNGIALKNWGCGSPAGRWRHLIASSRRSAQGAGERRRARLPRSAVRSGSFKQAAELLEQAARSGNAEAQYQLASLYRSGRGVAQDPAQAFKWMAEAAGRGHVKAQFNLGKMYLSGYGTAADRKQAEIWLQRAAAKGNDNAIRLLSELASHATGAGSTVEVGDERQQRTRNEHRAAAAPQLPPSSARASANGTPPIVDAAWRGQVTALKALIAGGCEHRGDRRGRAYRIGARCRCWQRAGRRCAARRGCQRQCTQSRR